MKMKTMLLAMVAMSLPAYAQMPEWSASQTEVWSVVEQSWVDDQAENGKWPVDYLHDNAVSWGDTTLIPRGKDAWIEWSRMGDETSTTVMYELMPVSIAMADGTAVVNYFTNVVSEDNDGKRETTMSGVSETLVREGDEWSFLSSGGFTMSDDD